MYPRAMLIASLLLSTSAAPVFAAAPIEVYVADGCPHCTAAKVYLEEIAPRLGDLAIRYHDVGVDADARAALEAVSRAAGSWPPGVPTFVRNGAVQVGFADDPHGREELQRFIAGHDGAAGEIATGWFGTLSAERLGLPLFTLALGLLDGFNPCAMWVLLFLLALLVRLNDRRRMALIAGTFVAVSGLVYYAFMAAWLNLFLAIGLSTTVRWMLAAVALVIGTVNVKDFFAFGHGVSFSIPASAKPGLYARMRGVINAPSLSLALLGVTALAVLVNFVELLCTAGLPALYTAVLTQHEVTPAGRYAYLALYIAGYIADDALMVTLAVAALGQRKLTATTGRWLKLLSGGVMLVLGVVLALRPDWLT